MAMQLGIFAKQRTAKNTQTINLLQHNLILRQTSKQKQTSKKTHANGRRITKPKPTSI